MAGTLRLELTGNSKCEKNDIVVNYASGGVCKRYTAKKTPPATQWVWCTGLYVDTYTVSATCQQNPSCTVTSSKFTISNFKTTPMTLTLPCVAAVAPAPAPLMLKSAPAPKKAKAKTCGCTCCCGAKVATKAVKKAAIRKAKPVAKKKAAVRKA